MHRPHWNFYANARKSAANRYSCTGKSSTNLCQSKIEKNLSLCKDKLVLQVQAMILAKYIERI